MPSREAQEPQKQASAPVFASEKHGRPKPILDKSDFSYDAVGNMTARLDAEGHATGYEYDPLSRLSAMTDPLGESQYSL